MGQKLTLLFDVQAILLTDIGLKLPEKCSTLHPKISLFVHSAANFSNPYFVKECHHVKVGFEPTLLAVQPTANKVSDTRR
jgi:hypothetical protein